MEMPGEAGILTTGQTAKQARQPCRIPILLPPPRVPLCVPLAVFCTHAGRQSEARVQLSLSLRSLVMFAFIFLLFVLCLLQTVRRQRSSERDTAPNEREGAGRRFALDTTLIISAHSDP